MIMNTRHSEAPEENAAERQYFFLASSMMSANLEVDKWEPLVAALNPYELREPSKDHELEHVWKPVYKALKEYKRARYCVLRGGRLPERAQPPAATTAPVRRSSPRSSTGSGLSASTTGANESASSHAGSDLIAPTSLPLPPVAALSGREPVFDDLSMSIQAASLGVSRLTADAYAAARATIGGALSTGAGHDAWGGSSDGKVSGDEEIVAPACDKLLLVRTACTLRRAVRDLHAIAMARISAWGAGDRSEEALAAATAGFGGVSIAAAVSCALDHSAVEIQMQISAVNAPHEDLFVGLGLQDAGPRS